MSDKASFGENQGHADSTQPAPKRGEASASVTDAVVRDLQSRRDHGVGKYGVELLSHNGRDAMLDAYQESLDTTVYLKQCLMERSGAAIVPTPEQVAADFTRLRDDVQCKRLGSDACRFPHCDCPPRG